MFFHDPPEKCVSHPSYICVCFFFFLSFFFLKFVTTQIVSLYSKILDNWNVISSVQKTCKKHTEKKYRTGLILMRLMNSIWAASSPTSGKKFEASKSTKIDLLSAAKRRTSFFYQVIKLVVVPCPFFLLQSSWYLQKDHPSFSKLLISFKVQLSTKIAIHLF